MKPLGFLPPLKALSQLCLVLFAVPPLFSSAEEKSSIPVETVTAVRSESLLTEIRLTGTVVSRRASGLSSRADGLVEEVMVDAGSQVKKGDVLLTLDTRFAEIDLELTRAEIEVARLQLRDAERKQTDTEDISHQRCRQCDQKPDR